MKTNGIQLNRPLVYVVVINWNGMEHLPVCLNSVKKQSYDNIRVLMVDNGSTDGSIDYARKALPAIEIISNRKNIGFAKASNQGLYYAAAKGAVYAILLNNDTECDSNFVKELVIAAQKNESIAACAPKILFFETRDIINGIGTDVSLFGYGWDRGLWEKDEGQYDKECEVFGMSGGAMLIRLSVIKELGAFDTAYYMYFEDIDLAWRIRYWGYRIVSTPRSIVYHKFSATTEKVKLNKEFFGERNRIRSVCKNFEIRTLMKILPHMIFDDCRRIKNYLLDNRDSLSKKRGMMLLAAYMWNILHFGSLIIQRQRAWRGRRVPDSEMMKFITPIAHYPLVEPDYHIVNRILFERSGIHLREISVGSRSVVGLGAGWGSICEAGKDKERVRPTAAKAYFYLNDDIKLENALLLEIFGSPAKTINGMILINGHTIGNFSIEKDAHLEVKYTIPISIGTSSVIEGCIVNNDTWRPHDFNNNGDYRKLGIFVRRISLISEDSVNI